MFLELRAGTLAVQPKRKSRRRHEKCKRSPDLNFETQWWLLLSGGIGQEEKGEDKVWIISQGIILMWAEQH